MKKHYSNQIAQAVQDFLEEQEWHNEFNEERGVFRFGITLNGRLRSIEYHIHISNTGLIIYGLIPYIGANTEDPEEMNKMLRFLTMANYKMRYGNFEIDCSDGEIRYKCFIDCAGLEVPTPEMIKNALFCVANTFERFGQGILQIFFTGMDAQDAMALCEKPTRTACLTGNDTSPADAAVSMEIPVPESEIICEDTEEDDSDLWTLLREMKADDHILDQEVEEE